MKELVSIVIPAYNIGDYLASCLDSVLAQTYERLEIVIVDDGSKDHTREVITAYAEKDTRIKPIFKENGGVTSARLRGVKEATGAWIGFVDGDDYVEPTMFEHLLQNAYQHDADISHCGYQMVFSNGKIDYYYNSGRLVVQDHETGVKDLVEGTFVEPGLVNKLYRRELLIDLEHDPLMDRSIRINEDLLMNYCLFKRANVSVHEDICPYHYVLRKGSAATSKINDYKLKDPLKVLDKLYADTADTPKTQEIIARRQVYQMIATATLGLNGQKELIASYRRQIRKRLRAELKTILGSHAMGMNLKVMALWAAVWPASYRWVHTLYGEISGSAHKFDV